jgi:hypothetical protein
MIFQLSFSNGARLRLIEISGVLFAVLNSGGIKRDTDLFPTRHLG